jgi:hypothetical protein
MAKKGYEKGLNRGGAGGQETGLGDTGRAGNDRPGWQQEQGNLQQQQQGNLQRKGGLGRGGREQGAQRGGLQHEPDLAGREEQTGHEVD